MRRILILFALLLGLCGAAWAETYRIGVMLPLSGERAEKGLPLKKAMQMFVQNFNTAHKDTQLELVIRDDGNEVAKAQAAARALVQDKSLLAVVAHYYTDIALATGDIFAQAGVPLLSPNVGNGHLVQDNPWAFMLNIADDEQGKFMATYVKEVLKKSRVLIMRDEGKFGTSLRDAFVQKAQRLGLQVVKEVEVPRKGHLPAGWVAQQLPDANLKEAVDVIVALGSPETGVEFLPQLRAQGLNMPVMASKTWADERFLSAVPESSSKDVYVISTFLWETANRKAAAFAREYQQQFGSKPTVQAAIAYDTLHLLEDAIHDLKAVGKAVTRTTVRDHLANIDWHDAVEGLTGMLYFNNKRDKTAEYVERYLLGQAEANGTPQPDRAQIDAATRKQERVLLRDVYVSVIKDGRFKVAMTQLQHPREEYVLKQLEERIKKGFIQLSDYTPYHIIDVVFVGVDVIRINDINIRDMLWDVDVFMWFKWAENRLSSAEIEKIGLLNSLRESSTLLKENLNNPIHYRAYRKRLTLEAPYDLSAFPFDSQRLPLSVAHINKNTTHIMLVVDSRHMDTGPVQDINPHEWTYEGREMYADLYKHKSTFGDPDYRMGAGYKSPIYFSSVNLDIEVRRILQPYLYTFFLPLVILLGIILMVLWVPLDQFTPRINASISGLVGILVYHMAQKNGFPKVGYTMLADYYFLLAYAFVVSIIISIIYIQYLMGKGEKALAKSWNHRFRVAAITSVLGFYGSLTLYAIRVL